MPHSNDIEEVHRASTTPSYHHVVTYVNPHQSRKLYQINLNNPQKS